MEENLSNQKRYIDAVIAMCCKLGTLWQESSLKTCQKLQNLVFPDGILWDKEIGDYRTIKTNEAWVLICKISDAYNNIGEGDTLSPVALCGWGDSNPHGFRHQILSLARLPLRHIRFFRGAKVQKKLLHLFVLSQASTITL